MKECLNHLNNNNSHNNSNSNHHPQIKEIKETKVDKVEIRVISCKIIHSSCSLFNKSNKTQLCFNHTYNNYNKLILKLSNILCKINKHFLNFWWEDKVVNNHNNNNRILIWFKWLTKKKLLLKELLQWDFINKMLLKLIWFAIKMKNMP